MRFVQWDDAYSINVTEVDRQHQQLFDLINELHEAMTDGRARHTVAAVVHEMQTMATTLKQLMDYTSYHFSTEETYMVEHAYPERDEHMAAHAHFIERVHAFKQDFDCGEALHPVEIVEVIRDWWQSHILVVDKRLGAFLNERGLT